LVLINGLFLSAFDHSGKGLSAVLFVANPGAFLYPTLGSGAHFRALRKVVRRCKPLPALGFRLFLLPCATHSAISESL
jgi:hypothetical protein